MPGLVPGIPVLATRQDGDGRESPAMTARCFYFTNPTDFSTLLTRVCSAAKNFTNSASGR